jgi:pimeloyl-ACP methyl ester carboxylesterase
MLLLDGGNQSGLGKGHTLSSPECGGMHCYTVPGRAGARNVVLIHGWGFSAKHYERTVVPALHGYNIAAFDNIGHGRSAHGSFPHGKGYFEACADRIATGMTQIGFDAADIVAWSMAAGIAFHLTRRHPELVQRLFVGGAGAQYPQPDVLGKPFQAAEAVLQRVPSPLRRVAAHVTDMGPLQHVPILNEIALNDPLAFVQAGFALYDFDSRSWVGELGKPTTVFIPEHDQLVSVERQTELHKLIPGARLVRIHSKLGHFAPIGNEYASKLKTAVDGRAGRRPVMRPAPRPALAVA